MKDDVQSRKITATALIQQGRVPEAKAQLLEIIRAEPDSLETHYTLATLLQSEGALSDARRHYEEIVRVNPAQVQAWFQLGNICHAQHAYEQAVKCYREAWQQEPRFVHALMNMGVSLGEMGRADAALEAYYQALEREPADPVIHYNIGEALLKQSRYKEAGERYQEAMRLKPDFSAAHVSFGRCLQALGRLKEALACHHRALQIDSHCWHAYHNAGICLFDDSALDSAANAFRKATELAPGNGVGHCYYGIIRAMQGKPDEAERSWAHARTQTPIARHIIESYQYTKQCAYPVRHFSTTASILAHAIDQMPPEGLVLEFGVYFGTSITLIANMSNRTVHGFDSFEGLPESWDIGDTWGQRAVEKEGSYSTGGKIPETPHNVKLHVGTFEETLPDFVAEHTERVSLINIDCDLYSSTRTVFKYLGDRIKVGTVIVFDEYFCFSGWREHEYRAFQEFLRETGLGYEYLAFSLFTGQAVVRITEP